MFFGGKVDCSTGGKAPGAPCLPWVKAAWLRTREASDRARNILKQGFASPVEPQAVSPELKGLVEVLRAVRKRLLANRFLQSSAKWLTWMLIAAFVVGLANSRLAGSLIWIAVLAVTGIALILVWIWRTRPPAYDVACRVDAAAGLKDRLSTAIYLGGSKTPQGIVLRQRQDALASLGKAKLPGLFPVRSPVRAVRSLLFLAALSGLLVYRIHHKPPLVSLLQTTERAQFAQAIFNPIVHAMERDLKRTVSLVKTKPEAVADARGSDASEDNLWKPADQKPTASNANEEQAAAQAGDQNLDENANQNTVASETGSQESNQQRQDGKDGKQSAENSSQQSGSQSGDHQSLSKTLMQALKNMLSNSPSESSGQRGKDKPSGQGAPQSGNSHDPGSTEGDKRGDSRGSSDAQQKPTQTASEGAGSQQGSKELRKNPASAPINAVPDRVALEANGFKEQTRMNVPVETGTAHVASRDQKTLGEAAVSGADDENIPPRYRVYVQRYFAHADKASH